MFKRDDKKEIILREPCSLVEFIEAVVKALDKILRKYGIIGYKNTWYDFGSLLTYPEDITIKDNYLYVADMGNKRVCSVNLIANEVKEYLTLKSRVFGFEKTDDMECIWLGNSCNMYLIDSM